MQHVSTAILSIIPFNNSYPVPHGYYLHYNAQPVRFNINQSLLEQEGEKKKSKHFMGMLSSKHLKNVLSNSYTKSWGCGSFGAFFQITATRMTVFPILMTVRSGGR